MTRTTNSFIDTHCHLNFKDYAPDRAEVIANAKKAGVVHMIVPGVDRFSTEEVIRLSRIFPGDLSATAGFHPYEAQRTDSRKALDFLSEKAAAGSVIAFGECGLDYHLYKDHEAASKKDNQKILFDVHLRLAIKYNLPVIIHCREAFADVFTVLDTLPSLPRGVFHCFGGGLEDLRMAIERGYYIGIDGNVTYSKSVQLAVRNIPADRLLLETDSPNLTPVPNRGKRNHPGHIRTIAAFIAGLRGETATAIGLQTTENAIRLFRISA